MITKIKLFAILIFLGQTVNTVAQSKPEVLTNASIISLHKAGLDAGVIGSKIESSNCKFDVSTNGLVNLKKQGVPDDIIKMMVEKGESNTVATKPASETSSAKSKSEPVKVSSSTLDLMNHVYVYYKTKQSPKALEKTVAGIRTKQGMFGGSAMLQVEGPKSAVQLKQDDAGSFAINTGSSALPELVLYKVKSVKNRREVASMKVNSFTGVKTGEDVITLDITKISEGVFQVSPSKKLEKGEYFFTGKPVAGANSMDAYTFGVE